MKRAEFDYSFIQTTHLELVKKLLVKSDYETPRPKENVFLTAKNLLVQRIDFSGNASEYADLMGVPKLGQAAKEIPLSKQTAGMQTPEKKDSEHKGLRQFWIVRNTEGPFYFLLTMAGVFAVVGFLLFILSLIVGFLKWIVGW